LAAILFGLLNRGGMRRELSPSVLAKRQAVKMAREPLNQFNPGNAIGDRAE
jgi:glycolate oxidase